MTIDYAARITEWTYENEYSIYSFQKNDATVGELMNGDYYVCLDRGNDLVGYFGMLMLEINTSKVLHCGQKV